MNELWIPCDERMPVSDGTLRGYLVSIGSMVTIMAFVDGEFCDGDLKEPEFPVDAWMYLPKSYEELTGKRTVKLNEKFLKMMHGGENA